MNKPIRLTYPTTSPGAIGRHTKRPRSELIPRPQPGYNGVIVCFLDKNVVMKKISLGIVGTGASSKMHLEVIKHFDFVNVSGVCSKSKKRATDFAAEHNLNPFASITEMINYGSVDITLIANENHRHFASAIEALECGSNVLIEKPLACSPANIDHLLNLAKIKKKHIDIVLQKRYDPHIVKLKNLVRLGAIGKIHLVNVNVYMTRDELNAKRIAKLNGSELATPLLQHLAIHHLDAALWVLDSIVEDIVVNHSIFCRLPGYPDTSVITMRMGNGVLLTLNFSVAVTKRLRNSIEIIGEKNAVACKANGIYDLDGVAAHFGCASKETSTTRSELFSLWNDIFECKAANVASSVNINTVLAVESVMAKIEQISRVVRSCNLMEDNPV